MIEFDCQCGKRLSAQPEWVGKKARCPQCQEVFQVPSAEVASAPASASTENADISMQCVCGRPLVAERAWAGKRAKCPSCGQVLRVPAPATATTPADESGPEAAPRREGPAADETPSTTTPPAEADATPPDADIPPPPPRVLNDWPAEDAPAAISTPHDDDAGMASLPGLDTVADNPAEDEFSFPCDCGKWLVAPRALAGQRAQCPQCDQVLIVPSDAQCGPAGPTPPAEGRGQPQFVPDADDTATSRRPGRWSLAALTSSGKMRWVAGLLGVAFLVGAVGMWFAQGRRPRQAHASASASGSDQLADLGPRAVSIEAAPEPTSGRDTPMGGSPATNESDEEPRAAVAPAETAGLSSAESAAASDELRAAILAAENEPADSLPHAQGTVPRSSKTIDAPPPAIEANPDADAAEPGRLPAASPGANLPSSRAGQDMTALTLEADGPNRPAEPEPAAPADLPAFLSSLPSEPPAESIDPDTASLVASFAGGHREPNAVSTPATIVTTALLPPQSDRELLLAVKPEPADATLWRAQDVLPAEPKPFEPARPDTEAQGQLAALLARYAKLPLRIFEGHFRRGIHLASSGNEIGLFLDTSRRGIPLAPGEVPWSTAVLDSVANNGSDLLGWLAVCRSFSDDLDIDGRPANEALHIAVFPRDDLTLRGDIAAAATYLPGSASTLMELDRLHGPARERELWGIEAMQHLALNGMVYWWGHVGVAVEGDGVITHVLIRGPQLRSSSR